MKHQSNSSPTSDRSSDNGKASQLSELASLNRHSPPRQQPKRSLQTKAITWAIAVSILPVLIVGTAFIFSSRSLNQQLEESNPIELENRVARQQQLFLLTLGTGATALLAGAIAAWLANRTLRPVFNAANASNQMVSRLRQDGNIGAHPDALSALENNTKLLEQQLPELLKRQESEAERSQTIRSITRRLGEAHSEEDVLETAVTEVRRALKTDRAVIFRFDPNGNGTFIEESVAPGLPRTLSSTIRNPYEAELFHNDRLLVIDDLVQTNLNDYHRELLERLAVKATLAAPVFKNNQLFGLLIVDQCSNSRFWQQPEIDLLAQVATQVSFALDHTRLISHVDAEANQAQMFIAITRNIRESLYEEDILTTTVQEVRKALRTDRVIVYEFDNDWYGTVVAESVLPGWPKALQAQIKDPCFEHGYVQKYQNGRVQAINNIYEAGLTECYLRQLEPFAVKANLVAPILKDKKLFGLLIAHQCSWSREWQQSDIDFFAQVATQVGFALDHARLLQRVDAQGIRSQLFADITRRIRESLAEEDILSTTVQVTRKALGADRVVVYGFDADWYGTVIAESVLPGLPRALQRRIVDPCFKEGYLEKYQNGRVKAINNIYEAGLSECYIGQLEPLAVKANLVAPILKDNKLFGLLIAHQCSEPRVWQQTEIDLLAQIALQVGFALDQARLLAQVERAYQSAQAASSDQRQQKEALGHQVIHQLRNSEAAINALNGEAISQMELVTSTYNQLRGAVESVREAIATAQQAEQLNEQINQTVESGQETLAQANSNLTTLRATVHQGEQNSQTLDQLSQKLVKTATLVDNAMSQLKLQATNAALEAARLGEDGQEFAAIAQKMLNLIRQLDGDISQIKPLVTDVHSESHAVATAMHSGTQQAIASIQRVEETQEKLGQLTVACQQMTVLVEKIAQAATEHEQTSWSANQSVLEMASVARQISEQSVVVSESFSELTMMTQEIEG